jgi:hypothetical protein
MKVSERFIEHVGNFRKEAANIVKMIVNELHLPEDECTIRPISKKDVLEKFALFNDDDNTKPLIFFDERMTNNIIIKLTH